MMLRQMKTKGGRETKKIQTATLVEKLDVPR